MTRAEAEFLWHLILLVGALAFCVLLIYLIEGRADGADPGHDPAQRLRALYDALHRVEASGRPAPPPGDGGRALGPYQIWKVYWIDALAHAPELGGTYADVRSKGYAEWIMLAYWLRWCPGALERMDLERLAVVHHLGGPNPDRDPAEARRYWAKVQEALAAQDGKAE